MVEDGSYAWLRWIPLLPLIAAAVHGVSLGLLRRPLPRGATIALSAGAPAISFVISLVALIELTAMPEAERVLVDDLFTWLAAGDFGAEFALLLDPLSAVAALLITGVGSLVHVAAIGLQGEDNRDDRGFNRFFAYLNLATFAMLTLVLAENLLVMFLGWQGVGLAAFLLIGFWYTDESAPRASMQSFIIGRIGDFGFLAGTLLLTRGLARQGVSGTAFPEIAAGFGDLIGITLTAPPALGGEWQLSFVIAGCFAIAALARSAQWPLQLWLSGIHVAPIPAGVMVLATSGGMAAVFLLCRLYFVFETETDVMAILAWCGALTCAVGSLAMLVRTDVRKVLVALTSVQLGLVFVAAGCGAPSVALFHAVTTAFFMPLLFLATGSIIRATRGQTDLQRLGGLWDYLHRTKWLFAVGALAVIGAPLTSGFYSREGVILAANLTESVPYNGALYLLLLATLFATGSAVMRLQLRIFHGRCMLSADVRSQVSEPDGVTLLPLYGFAFLAAMGGFLGPAAALNPFPVEDAVSNSLANFLIPLLGTGVSLEHQAGSVGLAVLSTFVSAAGALLAWYLIHERPELGLRLRQALPKLDVLRGLSLAAIYEWAIVRPLLWFARVGLWAGLELRVLDGLFRGSVRSIRATATGALRAAHAGRAGDSAIWMVLGSLAIASYLVA